MLNSKTIKGAAKSLALVGILGAAVLAIVVIAIFVFRSGTQSSTDEALIHPEKNYLGTLKFDIDPRAGSIIIAPAGKPSGADTTAIPGVATINNVMVRPLGPGKWNGETGSLDFDVQLWWNRKDAELYNVRISPSSSTNMNVRTANSVKCNNRWSDCLPDRSPAIVYVADNQSDGPLVERVCFKTAPDCSVRYLTAISAGCNSLVAHWSLQEGSGAKYSFLADLWGDAHPSMPLTSDAFYDRNTASIYLRTFKLGGATGDFPKEGEASNTMAPGEWFYVHYYIDNPGSNQAAAFDQTPGLGDKHIEDTGNIAAWGQGTDSSANYWTVAEAAWSIRFDPAVIELNSNSTNDLPGNGMSKFTTATGTQLTLINDPNGESDGYDVTAAGYLASNSIGIFSSISPRFMAKTGFFPDPCGTMPGNNCNAGDGFNNMDWDVGYIPLRVKSSAVTGQGSYIHISWDSRTILTAFRTNGKPYSNSAWFADTLPRSTKWPNWCEQTPRGTCMQGQYNSERTYICVQ